MGQTSSKFRLFSSLPPELRAIIWEHAYENTPPRTIKVVIYYAYRLPFVVVQANRVPLIGVNGEARQLLMSRFVYPFPRILADAFYPFSLRFFESINIDLQRDTLSLCSADFTRRKQDPVLPVLSIFRYLFQDQASIVGQNLVHLKLHSCLHWAVKNNRQNCTLIKTRLPCLQVPIIHIAGQCNNVLPCLHPGLAGGFRGLKVLIQYCGKLFY